MDEFQEYYNEEFFIIDSDNLNYIGNKLFGFLINNGKIITSNNISHITGEGTYIYLENKNNEINIYQDFNGNYGLYLFQRDKYFAISNSFLKLVEYLKDKYELSLNKDYANYFMTSGLNSTIYKETLVNEIKIVPRNKIIIINKVTKSINFNEIDYKEHSIELKSKEALDILDSWFDKWVNIIRLLKEKTNNIQFDLSGGFDSRVMLTLLLSANVDLNKIEIRSFDDGELCHSEDYTIANDISNYFNFKLNNKVIDSEKINFKDIKTPLTLSFYTKLGFHNQLNYKFFKTTEPVYNFSGLGGENLRSYINMTSDEYLKHYSRIAKNMDSSLFDSTYRILESTINKISDEFNLDKNSKEICKIIFNETRSRNHFGKLAVEEYFSNKFLLMPFFDPKLHKLKLSTKECNDDNLLFALIYLRYCPDLLNFKFQGNRKIDDNTIKYAEKINELYPFTERENIFISGPEIKYESLNNYYNINYQKVKWESDGYYIKWNDLDNYLREIFHSIEFKKEFEKYFSSKSYYKISETINQETYFPLQKAYPAFSILKVIDDINFSKYKNKFKLMDWFESFDRNNLKDDELLNSKLISSLLKYFTLRIDIKNNGNASNTIKILENSDNNSKMNYPAWFSNDKGKGFVLESEKCKINISFKCIGDGLLTIKFRGKDIRDKNKNRFPVYVDLTKVLIDGSTILNENRLVWHDKPYFFKKEVKNGEIISIDAEWVPFTQFSKYK